MPDGSRARLLAELREELPPRVVAAMAAVDRRCFVPEPLRARAWEDHALDIGHGQTISQPSLVARMAALLAPGPEDRVLDVGTGSGYAAAVLARLAGSVVSIECRPELSARAAGNLAAAGITGVALVVGDGGDGHPAGAPYDAVHVAAAVAGRVPDALLAQLADGGRLLLPVRGRREHLTLITRHGGRLEQSRHGQVRFVPFVS